MAGGTAPALRAAFAAAPGTGRGAAMETAGWPAEPRRHATRLVLPPGFRGKGTCGNYSKV